jgi:hypothetical protein
MDGQTRSSLRALGQAVQNNTLARSTIPLVEVVDCA